MDIILIPGLWLDGSSWDRVVPALEQLGHRAHPVTLPGMESAAADRSQVTLPDLVSAITEAVDASQGPVTVVGHSAAGGLAYAAVDARPDRVAHAVYVGGFPTGDGAPLFNAFKPVNGELPLPPWSEFDAADLVGLDEAALEEFRARSVPSPGCFASQPQRLSDPRRYDVPVTAICTEYTSDMLRGWIENGSAPVREFPLFRSVSYIDLPTGHWPQFTRPVDLAKVIAGA
jgi:pimeloyl-ACP methyl ester carboxylesterase